MLVFPCLAGHLLWVCHPDRGWEVPGGKIEPGESAVDAAKRELWEESGAACDSLHWIAEYEVPLADHPQCKWVFIANVSDVGARPRDSEIVDVRLFRPVPTPYFCRMQPNFSWIMQDAVYPYVWPFLQPHLTAE